MQEDFGYLSCNGVSTMDAEHVANVLLATWMRHNRQGSVTDLINYARGFSPTVIRPLRSDEDAKRQLEEELRQILDAIEGFHYEITRGFLCWTVTGLQGRLPFDCFDRRFEGLQQRLIEKAPRTLDDIERLLLSCAN
jgi:hypothetical protein